MSMSGFAAQPSYEFASTDRFIFGTRLVRRTAAGRSCEPVNVTLSVSVKGVPIATRQRQARFCKPGSGVRVPGVAPVLSFMAWQNSWKPQKLANVLTATCAPWLIELPNGKKLHGRKVEIIAEARRYGVDRMYDRLHKQWVRLDLATGKIQRVNVRA